MNRKINATLPVVVALFVIGLIPCNIVSSASPTADERPDNQMMLGTLGRHVIQREETLLDVARMYDLGFNEIEDLYPDWDPWLPPQGETITLPSQWIVPEGARSGILINTAELRLYYFDEKNATVITFPIGIGDPQFPTPEGEFQISVKIVKPTWTVPPSLRHKYEVWTVPAGPDNPLGEYWLGLNDSGYGIHGTNFPWSIGRLATQGCIRLYPEDIRQLFDRVQKGTAVKIIYEPIKISRRSGSVFIEVHKDVYGKIRNLQRYALTRLHEKKMLNLIDLDKLNKALRRQSGVPQDISHAPALTQN